jgi:hypothetical protein
MNTFEFFHLTGYEPRLDDLERANCLKAGTRGHRTCGWCKHKQPLWHCSDCSSDAFKAMRENN